MAPSSVLNGARSQDTASGGSRDGSVPSGFILKLFQMVSGAPDDLISWTPSGDAFKIGADLNRLEAETLPQYFRHSRFQSLVRQLNFYNFRKVNRERTFWVYKHQLFHRDRPEDLHLLRRRTCPGVDGRKNRVLSGESNRSADSGKGTSAEVSERVNASRRNSRSSYLSDDGTSGSSADESSGNESRKTRSSKRILDQNGGPSPKRSRRADDCDAEEKKSDESDSVNLAARFGRSAHGGSFQDDSDTMTRKACRSEIAEQSLIVSEVSRKLEEFAKMAKKGQGRTRSGRGGIVTPPTGTFSSYFASGLTHVGGLLTYDDEFPASLPRRRSNSSVAAVSDVEENSSGEDESSMGATQCGSPFRSAPESLFTSPPIQDAELVKIVTTKLLSSGPQSEEETLFAFAAVVGFCMTTAPGGSADLCSKILHLVSSSAKLASEFQQYRAALRPPECSTDALPPFMFSAGFRKNHAVSLQQIWESATSRNDAVRDFKTFAVNRIQTALKNKKACNFCERDMAALQHTSDVWFRSACAN